MKKYFSKEVQIALAVIIAAVLLITGIDFLKGINIFKPTNYYVVIYKNVNGLAVSSPVKLEGYQVGLVREINYNYQTNDIAVTVALDKELRLPAKSKAVFELDILGSPSINLLFNHEANDFYAIGDTIIGIQATPLTAALQEDVMPQLLELLPKLDSILAGVNMIVNDKAVSQTLARLDRMTESLEKSTQKLSYTIDTDLPKITKNITTITHNLTKTTDELASVNLKESGRLANETLENLNKVSKQLTETGNTAGLLLNDPSLYNGLVKSITSVETLMNDLKLNPKKYVHFSLFGK